MTHISIHIYTDHCVLISKKQNIKPLDMHYTASLTCATMEDVEEGVFAIQTTTNLLAPSLTRALPGCVTLEKPCDGASKLVQAL